MWWRRSQKVKSCVAFWVCVCARTWKTVNNVQHLEAPLRKANSKKEKTQTKAKLKKRINTVCIYIIIIIHNIILWRYHFNVLDCLCRSAYAVVYNIKMRKAALVCNWLLQIRIDLYWLFWIWWHWNWHALVSASNPTCFRLWDLKRILLCLLPSFIQHLQAIHSILKRWDLK